jgi:hypothetical protein
MVSVDWDGTSKELIKTLLTLLECIKKQKWDVVFAEIYRMSSPVAKRELLI